MANHGELVGQFVNGKTTVESNEQITDGIAIAVQNANTEQNELLREQNQILRAILAKGGNVFDAVREEYIQQANRSGYTKDPVFE